MSYPTPISKQLQRSALFSDHVSKEDIANNLVILSRTMRIGGLILVGQLRNNTSQSQPATTQDNYGAYTSLNTSLNTEHSNPFQSFQDFVLTTTPEGIGPPHLTDQRVVLYVGLNRMSGCLRIKLYLHLQSFPTPGSIEEIFPNYTLVLPDTHVNCFSSSNHPLTSIKSAQDQTPQSLTIQ